MANCGALFWKFNVVDKMAFPVPTQSFTLCSLIWWWDPLASYGIGESMGYIHMTITPQSSLALPCSPGTPRLYCHAKRRALSEGPGMKGKRGRWPTSRYVTQGLRVNKRNQMGADWNIRAGEGRLIIMQQLAFFYPSRFLCFDAAKDWGQTFWLKAMSKSTCEAAWGSTHSRRGSHVSSPFKPFQRSINGTESDTWDSHWCTHIPSKRWVGGSESYPWVVRFFQTGMRINNHIVVSYMHPMTSRLCVG